MAGHIINFIMLFKGYETAVQCFMLDTHQELGVCRAGRDGKYALLWVLSTRIEIILTFIKGLWATFPNIHSNLPLVITEFVAVVIGWDNVSKQDVLGFGVHPCHLDLVARKHPPVENCEEKVLEMIVLGLTTYSHKNSPQ